MTGTYILAGVPGIVGGLGTKNVGLLNSGALIPDLCVWVDCDPEIAIMRIRSGSLRKLHQINQSTLKL